MAQYTNNAGIPLSIAVWLATDDYDHNDDPNHISATSLLKPIKQLILANRIPKADDTADIAGLIPSRYGSAIHNSIEEAWKKNYKKAMKELGHAPGLIKRIVINPDRKNVDPDAIPVYMEQRLTKKLGKYTVSGKFDFVGSGQLEDFKSTSTYAFMHGSKDEDYAMQGSIYRWLDPELITKETIAIRFIFTDWKAAEARQSNLYPPLRIASKEYPLLSIQETERFVVNKLNMYFELLDADESKIPACTDKDLWRAAPVWKYYKNPASTGRSTKNFPTASEAQDRLLKDGSVGKVIEVGGKVNGCKYCPAVLVCKQKDEYLRDGSLVF